MITRAILSLFVLSVFLTGPTWASSWPDHPIRLIVPFPAGGGVDAVARIYGLALTNQLGQQVVIENRPGASGAIGAQAVVRSDPDGYTFLMSSPAEVLVNEIAGQKMPYDSRKDLTPIALAGETPLAIVAYPKSVDAKNLKDFIALVKNKKLMINYGTPGNGSSMNFAGEALKSASGLSWQHIPYKGAAPAVNDVLGGQIETVISGLPPLVQHIKAGKLTALAVTSEKRSGLLPNVMAVSELPDMASFRFTNWMGVFAPRQTPPDIVERLGQAIADIAKDPKVQQSLKNAGVEPSGIYGDAFIKFLDAERQRYQDVAKQTKFSIQ